MQHTDTAAETPSVRYDLLDILSTLVKRRNFILLLAGLSMLVGLAVYFISPAQYAAKAEIMVGNPMTTDRARLFSQGAYVDYFANEQINDRALAIANSDYVTREIIRRNGLMRIYKISTAKPGAMEAAMKRLQTNLEIHRTEFGTIQISFKNKKPQLAAKVANSTLAIINEAFDRYLSGIRLNAREAVRRRIVQSDSAIRVLTDSLVALRERSGIYDIISPNRYGLTMSAMRSTDARAIEEIQNLESIKDQYVIDRTRYVATAAESSTGINDKDLPVLQVISPAEVPGKRSGMGLLFTLITYTLVGLFFGILWVIFSGWYVRIAAALRNRETQSF